MRNDGFTLMELLVAMAVLVITALIAIPSMRDFINDKRLRSASEELYQRLYLAKSQAIDNQENVIFFFSTGSNWCYGANPIVACNCNVVNNCNMGSVTNNNNQVSLAITGFNSSPVQINGGRGSFLVSGSATFSLNGKNITINASRMGRVTICSDSVGGYKTCS